MAAGAPLYAIHGSGDPAWTWNAPCAPAGCPLYVDAVRHVEPSPIASLVRLGLEPIIIKGKVDIVFAALEHSMERNYPVGPEYEWDESRTGSGAYVGPTRPIHILTGAAGCPEDQDAWQTKRNPFSAFQVNDYGYSRLTAFNATHMRLQYVDNKKGAVLDEVIISKQG